MTKESLLLMLEILSQTSANVPILTLANVENNEHTKKYAVLVNEIKEALKNGDSGDSTK